jgi:hypothetical protein
MILNAPELASVANSAECAWCGRHWRHIGASEQGRECTIRRSAWRTELNVAFETERVVFGRTPLTNAVHRRLDIGPLVLRSGRLHESTTLASDPSLLVACSGEMVASLLALGAEIHPDEWVLGNMVAQRSCAGTSALILAGCDPRIPCYPTPWRRRNKCPADDTTDLLSWALPTDLGVVATTVATTRPTSPCPWRIGQFVSVQNGDPADLRCTGLITMDGHTAGFWDPGPIRHAGFSMGGRSAWGGGEMALEVPASAVGIVMDIRPGRRPPQVAVHIHFGGYSTLRDEWVEASSPRIRGPVADLPAWAGMTLLQRAQLERPDLAAAMLCSMGEFEAVRARLVETLSTVVPELPMVLCVRVVDYLQCWMVTY